MKYRKGHCLSLSCENGKYLGCFISEKCNKYYAFTLIGYVNDKKPSMDDFVNGRFFGKYFQSIIEDENYCPATERLMLACLETDTNPKVEKIGSLDLIDSLAKASYGYWKDLGEVLKYYLENISQGRKNTENFNKQPNKISISNRLIEIKRILKYDKGQPESTQDKNA